jgi:hypothetical protein
MTSDWTRSRIGPSGLASTTVRLTCRRYLVAVAGGIAGTVLGAVVTWGYAATRNWLATLPAWVVIGGIAVTVAVGAWAASTRLFGPPGWRPLPPWLRRDDRIVATRSSSFARC